MGKKQLAILFVCTLVPYVVGNGVLPLLPVYATRLGASSAVTGLYLSFCYLAIAVGAISAGWLADRIGRRKSLLIAVQAISIPATALMGRAAGIGSLTLLTAFLWLTGGIALALVNILAGTHARQEERGKVFGVLSLANSIALVVGGLSAGPMVDRWGYPTMFAVLAGLLVLPPLAALLFEDRPLLSAHDGPADPEGRGRLGGGFWLLFASGVVGSSGGFVGILGRSMAMDRLGFAATAISSISAVGGLVSLPLPLLAGWLADRWDRKRLLVAGSFFGLASALTLVFAAALWHFWLSAALGSVSFAVSATVGPALVMDLVPKGVTGKAISLHSGTGWIGGILGFAGTGLAIQALGLRPSLAVGAGLSVVSATLVAVLYRSTRRMVSSS